MKRGETGDRILRSETKTSKPIRPLLLEYGSQASLVSGSWSSSIPSGEFAPIGERSRSALKIRLDILEVLRDEGPSNPTMILTRANLSHDRLVKYLGELVSRGLLNETKDDVTRSYALTASGLDFVNQMKKIEAFVATCGLVL